MEGVGAMDARPKIFGRQMITNKNAALYPTLPPVSTKILYVFERFFPPREQSKK